MSSTITTTAAHDQHQRRQRHYPRTIENGAGERLTFLGLRTDPDGRQVLDVENQVQPDSGPPMHVHHLQEESRPCRRAASGYRLADGPDGFAGPGDTVTFAPGQMHRFWNAGGGVLRCSGRVSPPGNLEYVLTEIFAFDAARRRPPESVRRGLPARPIPDGDRAGRHPGTRSASLCSRSCAP